jgi:TPR repeat protein
MLQALRLQGAQGSDQSPEVAGLYERACRLGLAIGCTNYAAGQLSVVATKQCTKRLFEAACAVKEPYGCGMVGRMMAMDAKTDADRAAARSSFERACADVGNVACFFYAVHLQQGDLGPTDPSTVKTLLERACRTGYREACGLEPK